MIWQRDCSVNGRSSWMKVEVRVVKMEVGVSGNFFEVVKAEGLARTKCHGERD